MKTTKFQSPVIEAQRECLQVLTEAAEIIEKRLADLEFKDYEMSIKPYNAGYELCIDFKFDWKDGDLILYEIIEKSFFKSITLQPETFFNDAFKSHGVGSCEVFAYGVKVFAYGVKRKNLRMKTSAFAMLKTYILENV
jgi:hypothetical protein